MPIAPTRIYHVNVNCSDLDRSLAFYCDLVGLTALTRTTPEQPQPGGAFGLEQVQWDAWILTGDNDLESPVLDLLEWKIPQSQGTPATDPTTTGFNRLAFTTADLDALHARLTEAGADVKSAPTTLELEHGAVRMFVCGDPDGTQIEFIEGSDTRMSHIVVNCSDLAESLSYYCDVLGFAPQGVIQTTRQPGALFGLDGDIEFGAFLLGDPVTGFTVELVEWATPAVTVAPARRANDLGIFRMAWVTTDIDADYAALQSEGVTCYSPPAPLEMGPGMPPLRALFWGDPDGACLELIQPG